MRGRTKSNPSLLKTDSTIDGRTENQPTKKRSAPKRSSTSRQSAQAHTRNIQEEIKSGPTSLTPQAPEITPANPVRSNTTTFLDLPPEIRNEIYAHSLNEQDGIPVRETRLYVHEPPLSLVNRQIRSEVLDTFYADNIFEVSGSNPAVKFLRSTPEYKLRSLRTLRIFCNIVPTANYARERIAKLVREFGGQGLPKQTIQFLVSDGESLVWANLEKLKSLSEGR